jgi:hypothetical protein
VADAYSRIYHRLMTEYPSVWRSPTQLALYVHLLVAAEKYYPEWPIANRRNGAYQSLLKAGLVIEKEGTDGYTIRGLEAERERRSHAARNAAASRWEMPRRDETSIDKTSKGNGQSPPQTFMGWKPKPVVPMDPRIDLADIERQQAESMAEIIRKTAEREAKA